MTTASYTPTTGSAQPPSASATPFHLTPEQVQFYDDNGYLILRNRVQGRLLARLQEAGHHWIAQGQALGGAAVTGDAAVSDIVNSDYNFANRPGGRRVLFRVNYLHNKGHSASLELLGSPEVLGIAESLNGRNFVPTYESMVFKLVGDGERIAWHQDAVFPRRHRVWNLDLYLDPSTENGGALRVVPKSHKQVHDVCKFASDWEWHHPDMIVVEMQPGDILIHDDMVLHGSPQVDGAPLRRTIYYEFRSVEQILDEGPWGRDFIDKRLRLIPVAQQRYLEQFSDRPQFRWDVDAQYRPTMSASEQAELKIVHGVHTSGSYCSAGSSLKT